jgi:hypothetical protein
MPLRLLLAAAFALLLAACTTPDPVAPAIDRAGTDPAAQAVAEAVERGDAVLDDQWSALLIADAKIGYVHTVTRRLNGESPCIVTSIFSEVGIRRMGVDMSFRTFVEQRETPTGAILSALSQTKGGSVAIAVEMTVREDKAVITTRTIGEPRSNTIAWDAEVLGPYAQTLKLRAAGLQPGAKIEYKVFDPSLQRVVRSTVALDRIETLRLYGKELALMRGVMTQDALPGIKTVVWLDERGDVVRSLTDAMARIETLRCTREEALSAVVPAEVMDVMDRFAIRTAPIRDAYKTRSARYRLHLPADAAKLLALEDRRQEIEERGEGSMVLRVRALGDASAPAARPAPEFLAASPYIQSDDADIIAAARDAAGEGTPAEKARRIEKWVHKTVAKKDYRVSFASAKEVLISREGDCTEHAVLMAALLRAAGIPSRVAVGVVYWKEGFAYHMWTEAFLNDWTAFDPTLREEVVDATHIKLGATALETSAASDAFLSLVQVIGKLRIDVLSTTTAEE